MTRAPKPMYTNQTYGTTEDLNKRLRNVDNVNFKEITGRNNNLPPAAVNTQDNVNNAVVNPGEEKTVSGSIATSETETINGDSVVRTNFDILRDTDFPGERLTAGAIPPTITPQEEGDMNFAVLADLAENSDVDALRRIYSYNL